MEPTRTKKRQAQEHMKTSGADEGGTSHIRHVHQYGHFQFHSCKNLCDFCLNMHVVPPPTLEILVMSLHMEHNGDNSSRSSTLAMEAACWWPMLH